VAASGGQLAMLYAELYRVAVGAESLKANVSGLGTGRRGVRVSGPAAVLRPGGARADEVREHAGCSSPRGSSSARCSCPPWVLIVLQYIILMITWNVKFRTHPFKH
jgi:hypothetical protein